MALVGSYGSGATLQQKWNVYCGARPKARPGPKDARAGRRCGASTVKLASRWSAAPRDLRPMRRLAPPSKIVEGIGTTPILSGLVVLCPKLRLHHQAWTQRI